MLEFLKGRALSNRLRQPVDEFWDRRFGIHTFGYNPGEGEHNRPGWISHYEPIAYGDIFRALTAAKLGRHSVFTDLGCGLGRGVFAAARLGARRIVGVELVSHLAEGTEANRRASRFRDRDIRIVQANALDHPLGETTHVYLFHAFGPDIIERVFARARAERRIAGITTPLRLIYANPVNNDVIGRLGWFRQTALLPTRRPWWTTKAHYDVAIWKSIDPE